MKNERHNLLTLAVLCAVILVGGDYLVRLWKPSVPEVPQAPVDAFTHSDHVSNHDIGINRTVPEALKLSARLPIDTPTLRGSINVQEGILDDVVLKDYHVTTQKDSPPIRLLAPKHTPQAYYIHVGVVGDDVGAAAREWRVIEGEKLTPQTPVTLAWQSPQGSLYKRRFSVDEAGMFFVTCSVDNKSEKPLMVYLSGVIERSEPVLEGQMWSHEGPISFLNGSLKEIAYKDLTDRPAGGVDARGWLGITDKYWLTAFAPYEDIRSDVRGMDARAQVSFKQRGILIAPGETKELRTRVFVGAKVLDVLDSYEVSQKIEHFDLAVDFGWFYFLTKPTFYVISWLKEWTGGFGAAILLFTVLLKLLFFPLANRSYRSMNRMKMLAPELEKLKARYKDDSQRMSQEVMALYKREKINPISGCLPMFLQFPFFFALYKVLSISIEMRHAPFWGWISDLSAPDPTNVLTLFGLIPIALPGFLHLGLWPLLMGVSMFLQQRLSPPPADPVQRTMFLYVMPVLFTFMFGQLAAGVVIYWTWNNLLSVGQQWLIMRASARANSPQKRP